uniref:Uncharacterized protein n=1 Tax=Anguilla anguilla TaxID=7936 RepID=A0A0E9PQX6_ANGAN
MNLQMTVKTKKLNMVFFFLLEYGQ